ncbi:hypothetical protein HK105_200936 [Polyrhizophydium stewartii]|uniref:UTP23 sensor motif region domain-containing protein n=1 Tax=Polyrhizophydium stewartii TaxID=2732419 RepID=A0ABR4NIE1_9FUNG
MAGQMGIRRLKSAKRHMGIYQHSFGFREPFQVLVDGNFLHVARESKKNLEEALPKILTGQVKLMTTYCCYAELRKLAGEFRPTAAAAKKLEKRRCTHQPAVSAAECLREIFGAENKFNYILATQDAALRSALRAIPGVPLLYINKSVLILEPPSIATLEHVKQIEIIKTMPKKNEVKVTRDEEIQILEPAAKKRKRTKEPNPLSVKRKKPKTAPSQPGAAKQKKAEAEAGVEDYSNEEDESAGATGHAADAAAANAAATGSESDAVPQPRKPKRKRKRSKKASGSSGPSSSSVQPAGTGADGNSDGDGSDSD